MKYVFRYTFNLLKNELILNANVLSRIYFKLNILWAKNEFLLIRRRVLPCLCWVVAANLLYRTEILFGLKH